MGPCMSLCESTPDVPKNIIADPEVRRTRARASSTIILGIIPFDHPSVAWVLSNDDDDDARESWTKD